MNVVVNGEPRAVAAAATVADLAVDLGTGPSGVAVAVNDDVIARSAWSTTELRDGDRVEVLGAMQGG
ncbi:sulfur carrier protein ThiS [soil metagenome]